MEWYPTYLDDGIDRIWTGQKAFFDGMKLKEIMLVVRPAKCPFNLPTHNPGRQQLLGLQRDVYGFVDYKTVRGVWDMFSETDLRTADRSYIYYALTLDEIFSNGLERGIKIHQVVDIDYESIGQTNIEGENTIYRHPVPWGITWAHFVPLNGLEEHETRLSTHSLAGLCGCQMVVPAFRLARLVGRETRQRPIKSEWSGQWELSGAKGANDWAPLMITRSVIIVVFR
ncbi:hypothetical protein CHU98_g11986 [Xylaria longipes]|nr:hypothetical protein CHU98_g11986 [Xylaria longipes]